MSVRWHLCPVDISIPVSIPVSADSPCVPTTSGRGTIDDKQCVLGHMEAIEDLLAMGYGPPERTVYLCFGHDEEIGGRKGAAAIAALLKRRGVRCDFLLDEGLFIIDGVFPMA